MPESDRTEQCQAAFMAKVVCVGPVMLLPVSVATLWMLETLNHPLSQSREDTARLSIRDTIRAIYIFSEREAFADLAKSVEELDKKAFKMALGIGVEHVTAISAAVMRLYIEALTQNRLENAGK